MKNVSSFSKALKREVETAVRVTWQLQFTLGAMQVFPQCSWACNSQITPRNSAGCTAQALHSTQLHLESGTAEHTLNIQKKHLYVGRQDPTMPFVCPILSPAIALILPASSQTYLLLQFVYGAGNTLFSLLPVLLRHGVLQILLQLHAQLNGRDKRNKITRQTRPSEQPRALQTFHCLCSKKKAETLVEATAAFKVILQALTGQVYFQLITDHASILTTGRRCLRAKFQPVLHTTIWVLTLNT